MKRRSIGLWVAISLIATVHVSEVAGGTAPKPEILAMGDMEAEAANFKGQTNSATIEEEDAPKEELFRKYGTRTFSTFKKHREIVASLKKLNPKFDPHTMATSDLNRIVTFNGRTFLILIGCYPHNCGGTQQLVAFDPADKKVYLLQPTRVGPDTTPSGKFFLYGDPDPALRAAMFKAYGPASDG